MQIRNFRLFLPLWLMGLTVLTGQAALAAGAACPAQCNGVVNVRSAYAMAETIARLQADIRGKGITFFLVVEQSMLAGGARLHPSTLLIFGNPALGAQYIAANPVSGLDWPVRLLVYERPKGEVWVAYTDFAYIAKRYGIDPQLPTFRTASAVIASIAASVAQPKH
jgi:uncharacterized protein (DUF302 family)